MSKEILRNIIDNFDINEFTHFFRSKNRSAFAPRTEDLQYYSDDNFIEGHKIGEIRFDDEEFIICSFMVLKPLIERSGKKIQYELGRKILKDNQADAGIFIFYDDKDKFRFSLIYTNYLGKKRDWSNYRRFTYLVHKDITNKTFRDRIGDGDFSSLESIKTAFSVEPLNKEFYKELSNWYFWALKIVEFPDDEEKSIEIRNAISIIRLITRLIFVWFMKQKNIITDALFEEEELAKILDNKDQTGSTYYKAILQNLFFATLNTKMGYDNRKFVTNQKGVQEYYRYGRFFKDKKRFIELTKDIPFLNGGLFENLDKVDTKKNSEIRIDCFSNDPNNETRLKVPDKLFFGSDIVDLSKDYDSASYRRTPVLGILKILKRYNFTIDENTPDDVEVALDPELLGLVFENLLASFNPETKKTARKATGSYYTPREIVNYMVDQSLKNYLKTELLKEEKSYIMVGNQQTDILDNQASKGQLPLNESHGSSYWKSHTETLEKNIYLLFNTIEDQPFSNEKTKTTIIQAIDKCKIIDPACGSGAFPIGILQKMVFLLHKLDPENKNWKELQYQKALKETEETFNLGDKDAREKRLKAINEAFDININEPDYARKLFLIENCIFGVDIQPIAVQIAKLRVFISLLVDQKLNNEKENHGILSLPNLETKFVAADSLVGLEKQQSIRNSNVNALEKELSEIRHKHFSANSINLKLIYRQQDKTTRINIAKMLINSGRNKVEANQIAQWDPYNQNTSAKWFNSEWMFNVKDKFDIVIGNPPYGIKVTEALRDKYFLGSKDSYGLFMSLSTDQLLKNRGTLSFIVSDTWLTIKSHFELRQQILKKQLIKVIRLNQDCFNATVNPSIFLLKNKINSKNDVILSDLTNISTRENISELEKKLLEIDEKNIVSTKRYAIFKYNQDIVKRNTMMPIFVASPKLFEILNDTNCDIYLDKINQKNRQVRHLKLNNRKINVVRFGDIADVKKGIDTGENAFFLYQNPSARGNYRDISNFHKFLLSEIDLENISQNEKLRNKIIEFGFHKNHDEKPFDSDRWFNGKYIVPYEKGGESNIEEGWLPNYRVLPNFFIDWSSESVRQLYLRTNWTKNKATLRNKAYWFKPGLTFSLTGFYAPTIRFKSWAKFDNKSSGIFTELNYYLVAGILCSKMAKYIMKNYLMHTVDTQVGVFDTYPFAIHNSDEQTLDIIKLVKQIYSKQIDQPRYPYMINEQKEVDKLVYKLYGLNEEDIKEVETWYARRYPKLARFADI